MNRETPTSSAAHRWLDALVRALDPSRDVGVEAELLKHFPFAKAPGARDADQVMRMPTSVHGAL